MTFQSHSEIQTMKLEANTLLVMKAAGVTSCDSEALDQKVLILNVVFTDM